MKKFDLELAKKGHPVCTRSGKSARIICFDRKGMYPIVALIGENEACMVASNTGESNINGPESDYDLFMVDENQQFVERVCKWLKENANLYIFNDGNEWIPDYKLSMDELLEDFTKAMEE